MQERGQKASRGGAPLPTLLSLERTIAARRDSAGLANCAGHVISSMLCHLILCIRSRHSSLQRRLQSFRGHSQVLWTGQSRGRSSAGTPVSAAKGS